MKATYELENIVLVIPHIVEIEILDEKNAFFVFSYPQRHPTFCFESEEQMVEAKNDLVKAINEFYEQRKLAL